MPEVAREVLTYFLSRPHAVDDLTGIARWRLLQQRMEQTIRETCDGLEWLKKQGFLITVERTFSDPLFRLNPERASEARSLVGLKQEEGD